MTNRSINPHFLGLDQSFREAQLPLEESIPLNSQVSEQAGQGLATGVSVPQRQNGFALQSASSPSQARTNGGAPLRSSAPNT